MNSAYAAILERRSIRKFTGDKLTREQIDMLEKAALASPSARNFQNWHFSFISDADLLDQISAELVNILIEKNPDDCDRFKQEGYQVFYHAPLVVFISVPRVCENKFVEIDAGIAVENLAIAAESMGLGSVIIGMVKDLFMSEKEDVYNTKLGFPADYRYAISIAIGKKATNKEAHEIGENKVTHIG